MKKPPLHMKAKTVGYSAAALAASMVIAAFAQPVFANDVSSDAVCVFTAPERSFLWCTATTPTVTLPVVFPDGATSASLAVSGLGYTATYTIAAEGDFTLSLPAATSADTENAYDLTLSFTGSDVVRTARLGVIYGSDAAGSGKTRCLAPVSTRRWGRVERRAVVPIPYGATSFSFTPEGGTAITDTGLDGTAGWFAFVVPSNTSATLAMTDADGIPHSALLTGVECTVVRLR